MNYFLTSWPRPFNAIKAGVKKIEGRVKTQWDNTPYEKMKTGDTITFENEETKAQMLLDVLFVHHYPNTRSMLETEGIKNVSSTGGTIEEGVKRYDTYTGYKENIPKHGIYAIGVKLRIAK